MRIYMQVMATHSAAISHALVRMRCYARNAFYNYGVGEYTKCTALYHAFHSSNPRESSRFESMNTTSNFHGIRLQSFVL